MNQILVKNALALWAECIDVTTVSGRTRITQFFAENKTSKGKSYWAGHLADEVSTDGIFDDSKRSGDRGQYCGLFIAYAGLGLIRPDIGHFVLPSTVRAASGSKWKEAGAAKPDEVDPDDIQSGDIITVGSGKRYGTHFALVVEVDGHVLKTVEANTRGELGNGKTGRGVVRRRRTTKEVQCVYRLDERHFVQGVC